MNSSTRQLKRLLSATILLTGFLVATAQSAERPNILFILADDHASAAVGAYGSKINATPNLDGIAGRGMLFRNCFVTNSICAPARAVILTGKYSHLNGVFTNSDLFDGSQTTVPKLLRDAGYQTAIVGKWHLKRPPTGFDHWRVLFGQGTYYNPIFRMPVGETEYTGYTTDVITDLAIQWLHEGREASKPFLLMCQHKAPHGDWQPGPQHLTMYDDVTIPEPPTLVDDYSGRSPAAAKQRLTIAKHLYDRDLKLLPPTNLTERQLAVWNEAYEPKNRAFRAAGLSGRELLAWKYQRYIKDYLRSVASIDDNVGRLLGYLDSAGLADDTVVIYCSDQGFFLGEHGWYDKRWMYEESLRTPLMIHYPGVTPAGSVDERMVMNLDIAPTLLEIAGVEVPADMQGRSLLPLLSGEPAPWWRTSIYYHFFEGGGWGVPCHYGVRSERYKLIYFYPAGDWELFDLQTDPRELVSVYDDPEYAVVVQSMKAELKRLQEELGEPEPEKSEDAYYMRRGP